MSIVLVGSTSGSITLQEPAVAGSNTINLPAATGTMALLQTPSFATTIGVGNATPSTSGAGITFPATQSASTDANTLDDYEEGDFTPTLTASSSGTITTTDRRGRYVKVGRQVTIVGYINVASVSSPVGDLRLGGFPFAAASDSDGAGCLQPYAFATTNTFTAIYFSTVASQTYGNIRGLNNGDQVTTMAANTKTNAGFQFTATYFV